MESDGSNFGHGMISEISAGRNVVRQKILDSMSEHKKGFNSTSDKLGFLVTTRPSELPPEIKDPIILRNSWKKKTFNYLIIALLTTFLLYEMFLHFDFNQWWQFIVVAVLMGTVVMYLLRFFE